MREYRRSWSSAEAFQHVAPLVALAIVALCGGVARAQAPADEAREASVGDSDDALPGYVRMRVADERPVGFAATGAVGYGYTESLDDAPGAHHRVPFSLAVSGQPLRFLGFGLRLDGRGDFHEGGDRGYVGSGALAVRAGGFVAGGLALGAHVAAIANGGDGGLDFDGLSLEATGLASYLSGGLSLALELGYRLDRSGNTASPSTVYLPGDRLAIGISDFDAFLMRLGAGYRHGVVSAMGEVRWDLLLGDGAPSAIESPLHVAAGARLHPSEAWQVELSADVALSSRPSVQNGAPFVVVDPRFAVRLTGTYRFGRTAAENAEGEVTPEDPVVVEPTTVVPAERTLEGTVRDENGAPIVDAHVVASVGGTSYDAYTDADGRFRIDGVPAGAGTVEITATQHSPHVIELGAHSSGLPDGAITLRTADAAGVLRGLVRDFDGNPVRANVRITPGGRRAEVGDDGTFELELEPGSYTVTVSAPGFRSQSRRVELSDGQVTIYNVDLRGSR